MAKKSPAAARARRLITLLGRFEKGARLSLDELAEELGTSVAEIADDLDTLSMCGVAPYDPLALVPVIVEDGMVEIWGDLPTAHGGVRLSSDEAAALAAALQAAGFTAEDPLTGRLLAASTAGFDAAELEQTIRTALASHDSAVYETMAIGIRERRVVEIEYTSGGQTTAMMRAIEPTRLFAERGAWYLSAWCRSAGAWRTFRVDRVRSAGVANETFPARPGASTSGTAFEPEGLPVARLRFTSAEPYIEREWPGARVVESDDAKTVVEVPINGTSWIARMVTARLGRVEVLEPADVRATVREYARVLRATGRSDRD